MVEPIEIVMYLPAFPAAADQWIHTLETIEERTKQACLHARAELRPDGTTVVLRGYFAAHSSDGSSRALATHFRSALTLAGGAVLSARRPKKRLDTDPAWSDSTMCYGAKPSEALADLARTIQVPTTLRPAKDLGVQFQVLRNGMWQLVRPVQLDTDVVELVTAAVPRVGDAISVRAVTTDTSVEFSAAVTAHQLPSELRTPWFRIRPLFRSGLHRAEFRNLIRPIGPLPVLRHRGQVRFPVHWPVVLNHSGSEAPLECFARDLSRSGLGIEASVQLGEHHVVEICLPTDVPGEPVIASGRVVRTSGGKAGLQIARYESKDALERYQNFVSRIAGRSSKSIVVAAPKARVESLSHWLGDAGYTVKGESDSRSLWQAVLTTEFPPDLVLVDDSFTRGEWFSQVLQRVGKERIRRVSQDTTPSRVRRITDRHVLGQ